MYCISIFFLYIASNNSKAYNIVAYTLIKYTIIIIFIYCYIKEEESLNCKKVFFIDIAFFSKDIFIILRLRCCIYKKTSFYLFLYSS